MKNRNEFTLRAAKIAARILTGAGLLALLVSPPPHLWGQQAAIHGEPIGSPSANTNAPASTNAPPAKPPEEKAKGSEVGFDKLAGFKMNTTDDMLMGKGDKLTISQEVISQIPASVKAFNEKLVSVTGFMLPLEQDHGKVTEFLLLRNQSACCYGATPQINEYVIVRLAGRGIEAQMDRLITATGTLHVGEIRENKFLSGIYRMEADKVAISGQ
ncbi:MAG TPA: DUF3299 domain-containing protein [Verrucomicrobiae bacterium]|jgi:hypothetical protein|nr:DUF3299 domain-containing protein [Verrucomicrobiae bacterium]